MRVALVNPPQPYLVNPGQLEPLGLGYVKAAADACAFAEVALLDMARQTDAASCVERLCGFDVCAYTASTVDYPTVVDIAQRARAAYGSRQVVGGPHTKSVRLPLGPPWDAVFYGEGEQTFPEYLRALYAGVSASRVWDAPQTAGLDAYVWPTRSQGFAIRSLVGSRGCAMRCAFCSASRLWPGRVRRRSPADVVSEAAQVVGAQGSCLFSLFDEDIGADPAWLRALCAGLKGLGVRWKAQMRVDRVYAALCETMRDAGCVEVDLGVESFDQGVLDMLRKHTTVEQNIRAIRACRAAGLPCRLYMMVGTPGHNAGTVDRNIGALEVLQGTYSVLNVCPFAPLPGTDVYDAPRRFGITIVDADTAKYHRYAFRRDADGTIVRPVWSAIDVDGMTHEELLRDIERLYAYTDSLDALNRGTRAVL